MLGKYIAFASLLVACGTAALQAQDAPRPRIATQIADVQWQVLPADAYDVRLSPDGRAWFTTMMQSRPLNRRMNGWADEYERPDPQEHWFPTLFEPGGRVWFAATTDGPQNRLLLRYDGKQWVDHELPLCDIGSSLYAGGRAFFSCLNQIHDYDGQQWTTTELWKVPPGVNPATVPTASLKAEPDGKGVIAFAPGTDHTFMRWRDGKWAPVMVPLEALGGIRAFQPDHDGIWMVVEGPRLLFVAYDAGGVPGLAALLRDLADEDVNVRAAAQRHLLAAGGYALRSLEERLRGAEASKDTDLAGRLRPIVEQIQGQRNNPITPAPAHFGPATIGEVQMLASGPQGRIFVGGQNVTFGNLEGGPAVIMRDPEGDYLSNRGNEVLQRWKFSQKAVPTPNGEALWLPGDGDQAGIALFDLRTGRLTHRCPDPRITTPIGGTADGILYARAEVPSGLWALMRYAPGRPRTHAEIAPADQWAVAYDSAIEADGSVVSCTMQAGLQRYRNGRLAWAPDIGPLRSSMHITMTGRNGGVLLWSDDKSQWKLVVGDDVLTAKTIQDLIADHPVLFAQTFTQYNGRGAYANSTIAYAADQAGRIWLGTPKQGAQVWANGHWISIADQLQAKGMPAGTVVYASAVGDGSAVYLSNIGASAKNVGLLASFDEDKLVLQKSITWDWPQSRLPVRTSDGTLWVCGNDPAGGQPPGRHAYALTEKGITTWVKDCLPLYADQFGNVFLLRSLQGARRNLVIWRDGEIRSELGLPGLGGEPVICTVDETRILVWTGAYLQELVKDGAQSGQYRLGRLIIAEFGHGNLEAMTIPGPGKLLAMLFVNRGGIQRKCEILDLAPLLTTAPATQGSARIGESR